MKQWPIVIVGAGGRPTTLFVFVLIVAQPTAYKAIMVRGAPLQHATTCTVRVRMLQHGENCPCGVPVVCGHGAVDARCGMIAISSMGTGTHKKH